MKNKFSAIFTITIFIVFLCAVAVGCENTDGDENIYTYDNAEAYASVAYGEGKTISAETAINSLEFEWLSGEVRVSVDKNADGIRFYEQIEGATSVEGADEKYLLRYAVIGKTLNINYAESGADLSKSPFKNTKKTLFVVLPDQESDKIVAACSAASVSIDGVKSKEFDVKTVIGNVAIANCSATDFEITSLSGSLKIVGCAATKSIELKTVGGAIEATDCSVPEIEADAVNGAITVSVKDSGDIDLATESGNVTLTLPETIIGFTAKFATESGSFSRNGQTIETSEPLVYLDGSTKIDVTTTSGNFNLIVGQ